MEIKNNVAFQLIHDLSAWESQSFRKWLLSPAHNTRPELTAAFDYLLKCSKNSLEPAGDKVFDIVFPGKKFDEKNLRHILSWLMAQLKSFMTWQELQTDPAMAGNLLTQHFRKRGFEPGFRQALRDARQVVSAASAFSPDMQRQTFRLDLEEYQWNITQKRAQDMPFDRLSGSLTNYFTIQMLQLGCLYRAQEAMGKQSPDDLPRLDALLQTFSGESLESTPATELYHAGFQMLSRTDEQIWPAKFLELLENHIHLVPGEEARGLLMMAINYGIGRGNRGDRDYFDEVLKMYEIGLKRQLLSDKRGYLTKFTYNNVLLLMIARKHWERAGNFLETYREQLAPEERDGVYRYNRAVFLFRKGSFDEAQTMLSVLSFTEPMYNLEARRMLLRIYFERKEIDALESLLDNLLTWVRRHGEIGYHREMYRNLARFTGKLLKIPAAEKERRSRLAQKIKDTPLVADREWLLEKVNG